MSCLKVICWAIIFIFKSMARHLGKLFCCLKVSELKISFEQEKTYLVREHQHEKDLVNREYEREKVHLVQCRKLRTILVVLLIITGICFRNFTGRNSKANCKSWRLNSVVNLPKMPR